MKNKIVTLNVAKHLKEFGFNEAVPHCFINNDDNNYDLELFSFFLCSDGILADIYEEEKIIRNLDPTKDLILNESEVYFDYNQDIRKLVARLYNGEEYMNDPKSYNMYVDSYTYNNWSAEEAENNKIILPNYNDGDFEFTTYRDVISAPLYSDVIDWFKTEKNIFIEITHHITENYEINYKYVVIKNPIIGIETYENAYYKNPKDALNVAILKAIELIKKLENEPKKNKKTSKENR